MHTYITTANHKLRANIHPPCASRAVFPPYPVRRNKKTGAFYTKCRAFLALQCTERAQMVTIPRSCPGEKQLKTRRQQRGMPAECKLALCEAGTLALVVSLLWSEVGLRHHHSNSTGVRTQPWSGHHLRESTKKPYLLEQRRTTSQSLALELLV